MNCQLGPSQDPLAIRTFVCFVVVGAFILICLVSANSTASKLLLRRKKCSVLHMRINCQNNVYVIGMISNLSPNPTYQFSLTRNLQPDFLMLQLSLLSINILNFNFSMCSILMFCNPICSRILPKKYSQLDGNIMHLCNSKNYLCFFCYWLHP